MASFKMTGLDDLIGKLENLSANTDEIARDAIDAAKPTLREALSQCIEEAANRGYATGELAGSIQATKTKQYAYGYYADVKPTGTDKKGVRNGEKLAYLEYGTSRQLAHPVMKRALDRAGKTCQEIMQEKVEEALKRLLW